MRTLDFSEHSAFLLKAYFCSSHHIYVYCVYYTLKNSVKIGSIVLCFYAGISRIDFSQVFSPYFVLCIVLCCIFGWKENVLAENYQFPFLFFYRLFFSYSSESIWWSLKNKVTIKKQLNCTVDKYISIIAVKLQQC